MADLEVRVDVSGIDRLLQVEPQRVEDWLDGFAEEMVTNMKNSFNTSPPGLTYQRGTVTHVASQPNYPPNVDTGAYRASIRQEKSGRLERTILTDVEYAEYLENGAEDVGLLPRPVFGPEFADARRRVEGDARRNLNLDEGI